MKPTTPGSHQFKRELRISSISNHSNINITYMKLGTKTNKLMKSNFLMQIGPCKHFLNSKDFDVFHN